MAQQAQGGGGGYDLGASLSVSTSATSGAQVTHGNKTTGGASDSNSVSKWIPFAIVGAAVVVAVVFLVRK